jgi:hypothetical protein
MMGGDGGSASDGDLNDRYLFRILYENRWPRTKSDDDVCPSLHFDIHRLHC